MEGSSNSPLSDLALLNTNVSNFVSVKLSGNGRNYLLWRSQMLCLLKSHNIYGIVDPTFVGPREYSQCDDLVKGWIFGSVSEDVLVDVYNLDSAKAVWDKLKSTYDRTASLQEDSALTKSHERSETEDIENNNNVNEDMKNSKKLKEAKNNFREAMMGSLPAIKYILNAMKNNEMGLVELIVKEEMSTITRKTESSQLEIIFNMKKELATEAISSNGSSILHIAVAICHNDLLNNLLRSYINRDELLKQRTCNGSTALHVAAIVGNRYATNLLVKKNKKLLDIQDNEGKLPLHKACEHMHLDIASYLLEAVTNGGKTSPTHALIGVEVRDLLANAISAKNYNLASLLLEHFPEIASKNDHVLMAMAKSFPIGLNDAESFVYPSLAFICVTLLSLVSTILVRLCIIPKHIYNQFQVKGRQRKAAVRIYNVLGIVPMMLIWVVELIMLPILIGHSILLVFYYLLWKAAKILHFPLITYIENKKKAFDDAEKILVRICNQIDNPSHYTRPILEAARRNAYKVVEEIIFRSREASQTTNENGHDIFQIAIMNRSEKIYNILYDINVDHRNVYRTHEDYSNNNILHLAARLAPSHEFNHRTGAALQLQQELQWFEEVKTLVFPTYIFKENIHKETPNMVFTREHQNLLKEAEQWMKTTAESCSITAALITTIVFAAAITVPGGNNQENGTPLFRNEIAFTIFAVSDAISLFASSTALLVFLSILTARFVENNFLVSLPRRLLIGLFTLLLSTIAMMVAFTATLFLVFCDKKTWMLAPICGLAFIPIAFFVTLQFPLMVDLFGLTQMRTFREQRSLSILESLYRMIFLMDNWVSRNFNVVEVLSTAQL